MLQFCKTIYFDIQTHCQKMLYVQWNIIMISTILDNLNYSRIHEYYLSIMNKPIQQRNKPIGDYSKNILIIIK